MKMALHCMQFHAGAAVMKEIMCSMHIRYVEHDVGLNRKHFTKIHRQSFAKLLGEIPAKPMTLRNNKKKIVDSLQKYSQSGAK
jgi:hypothetical protein